MNKGKSYDEGFTLIELILSLITLGILSLILMSKLIHYINLVEYTNIVNSLALVEIIITSPGETSNYIQVIQVESLDKTKNFTKEIKERRLYRKDGYIVWNKEDRFSPKIGRISKIYGEDLYSYYLVDKSRLIKSKAKISLKGDFYINGKGDILYLDIR